MGKRLWPDLVHREFTAAAPDQLWVGDLTQHRTDEGWLYLAVVIDAVNMAVWNRRPAQGVIHHSDHGAQYTSLVFSRRLQEAGIIGSMGSVGDALDNAVAESFYATLQTELLDRQPWPTRAGLRTAIFEYIEAFYNRRRRHSTLGYLSPANSTATGNRVRKRLRLRKNQRFTVSTKPGQLHI